MAGGCEMQGCRASSAMFYWVELLDGDDAERVVHVALCDRHVGHALACLAEALELQARCGR